MGKKITFTKERLDKANCPSDKDRTYVYDAVAPGLALCITSAGSRSFYCYRWNVNTGQPVRVRLGGYPDLSIEQARKLAVQAVADIAKGIDPGDKRRKARVEMTFGELFGMYLEHHAKPHKRTWQSDQDQFDRYLDGWKARKLSTIKRGDVARLHSQIGETAPYAANRMLALLSAMFNYAVSDLDYEGVNPAKGVKKYKEQSRDRFLHADEIGRFFRALKQDETPQLWQDFFFLSLLTGARRANLEAMKWADIELTRGLWKIGEDESKNKEPLLCVLAPPAVEILQRRHTDNQAQDTPSEYVFPSHGASGHVCEPKTAWADILDRAGIKDLRIHDLRRTLGSWQAAAGASLSIIGRSLGHKNVATTAIYARLDLDPVQASVNVAAAAIMAAGNGEPKQKALPGRPETNR